MQFCRWRSHSSHLPRNSARGENVGVGGVFLVTCSISPIACPHHSRYCSSKQEGDPSLIAIVSSLATCFISSFAVMSPQFHFSRSPPSINSGRASVALLHQIHLLSPALAERYQTKQCCTKTISGKLMHHPVLPPHPLSRQSIQFIGWLMQ